MSEIRRILQNSSIVTFIIISVLLTSLLIGTVYFLKQYGQQVRKDQAIAVYDKEQADKKATQEAELIKQKKENENINTNSTDNVTNSNILPVTGSESVIIQLIEISVLTFVVTSYLMSRRNLILSLDL